MQKVIVKEYQVEKKVEVKDKWKTLLKTAYKQLLMI
jgi:hypothetical protein